MNRKQCAQELPKGAKICPACGKKHSNTAVWITLLVTAALLLLLSFGAILLLLGGGVIAAILLFLPNRADKLPSSGSIMAVEQATLPEGNPYADCFDAYTDYILAESEQMFLCREDIEQLSDEALYLAQQEIYARQGATFADADVQAYFNAQPWYSAGTPKETLSAYAEANATFLEVTLFLRSYKPEHSDNPYIHLYGQDTNISFFPDSHCRYLGADDLKGLTLNELLLARSEILARQGVVFADKALQSYFCTKNWYQPSVLEADFRYDLLNTYEQGNMALIEVYEKRSGGVTFSDDNPYTASYEAGRDYIFPDSSTRELSDEELFSVSPSLYALARNEIMARHGYTFSDEHLLEYFLHYSWYLPDTVPGNAEKILLSAVEQRNVQLLRQQQELFEEIPDLSQIDKAINLTVTAPGFTLRMPNYWSDCARVSVTDTGLRFQERFSMDTTGGHLFTLALYPDTSYTDAPSYNLVGYLDDGTGTQLHLVAHYPTDVQCCTAATALYGVMDSQIPAILETICAAPGYTYTPA